MPGMMDTVLNLGLNDATVEGLAAASGDARFAWDSYRRFIQMYADVVLELDHGAFEEALEIAKEDHGFTLDTELTADDLRALVAEYKGLVEKQWGKPFPQDVHDQLWGAVGAVFGSWQSERAKVYRRLNDIPGDWGTAVNVQAMVFGNMGDTSATGVAFTRDPAKGDRAYYGEFLINAQGEDVVAGIRTPQYLTTRRARGGGRQAAVDGRGDARGLCRAGGGVRPARDAITATCRTSSSRSSSGKLWMLQTRVGQAHRQGRAQDRGRHGERGADHPRGGDRARRSDGARPAAPPDARSRSATRDVLTKGLPASPGAASGAAVFDADTAEKRGRGRRGGDPRPHRDLARGHPRHARGEGHPDRARRHDQPRRGRRARHGPAVRLGRGIAVDLGQGQGDADRRA